MVPQSILVEDTLVTAAYVYPFASGWLDAAGIVMTTEPSPADLEIAAVALLDSIEARVHLRTHTIVRQVAVATRRHSMLTLATHARPDDVMDVTIVLDDLSPAARAVAAIVIPEFYGITAAGWTTDRRALGESTAIVTEGAAALIPIDDEESYQEDLGRAWFLMTDAPLVTHACLARRDLVSTDPEAVALSVGRLIESRELARSRGRELRRNLSSDLGVEREVLADALLDQSLELGSEEEAGLIELWKRSGRPLGATERRSAFVSIA